jgi:hypothetical protein
MSDATHAEPSDLPSGAELREALVKRIAQFAERTGMTKSDIGKKAVNDVAFVSDLEGGRNITLRVYDKVLKFLDDNEPRSSARRRP